MKYLQISKRLLCAALVLALCLCLGSPALLSQKANAVEVGATYALVTDLSQLSAEDEFIIAYVDEENDTAYVMGGKNTNYRSSVTVNNVTDKKTIVATGDMVSVGFVLVDATTNTYNIQIGEDVLYYGGSSTQLKTGALSTDNETTAQWTIAITDGEATICNASAVTRFIKYSTADPRFAAYTTGNAYKSPSIYKLVKEQVDEAGSHIKVSGASFVLDDITYIRYYLNVGEGITLTQDNCGVEYWNAEPADRSDPGTPDGTVEGFGTSSNGSYVCIGSIPAKDLNKTQYFRVYVVVDNVKHYTTVYDYSLAQAIAGASNAAWKEALEALQAYGEKAAAYFASAS